MGRVRKKSKKGKKDAVSQEEWVVRYDILKNSLWVIVKGLLVLDMFWYILFLANKYGHWKGMLIKVMAVPAILFCMAILFEECFAHFSIPLHDWVVLLILDVAELLMLLGDRWSHGLESLCVLPIIFCMILGQVRHVYVQTALSVAMAGAHFIFVETRIPWGWETGMLVNLTGAMYSILVVSQVVIEIRKYTQMLDVQTTIDSLTRLHNHEAFYEELDSRLAEYGTKQEPLSILIADIDNFKKVNDTYGHAYGDKVLKALAGIFREQESKKCFVARYGGEEFAMIMQMDQSDALTKAQGIRTSFEQKKIVTDSGLENSFTVSIGVAAFRPEFQTSSQFFEKADAALYKAKASGKNRVCL